MRKLILFIIAGLLILPLEVRSQIDTQSRQKNLDQKITFTENRGQLRDQNSQPRPDVLFNGSSGELNYYLRNNGLSYQLTRVLKWSEATSTFSSRKDEKQIRIPEATSIYRVDINWKNANRDFEVITDAPIPGNTNYYLSNCPNGVKKVMTYSGVTFREIYKGIDIHYYEKEGVLKYDFIVAPYADFHFIQMEVKGAKLQLQANGDIVMITPFGNIIESAPVVYQAGQRLPARWKIMGNVMSFDIEGYASGKEMIIDPGVRVWGTYYGGVGADYGYSCATDASGNVYLTGSSGSPAGIATSGSHQQLGGGGSLDAFVVKFNSQGVRQWATYYGGSGLDWSNSCVTDIFGNVFIAGYTQSGNASAIATGGSHQQTHGGGTNDAFIAKFNSSGVRQWGTYYGGSSGDYGQYCSITISGDVFLCGYTQSTNGTMVATSGSHQQTAGGGWEGFLVKFSSGGIRQWGTYYGGSGTEYAYACCTDAAGNTYLTGGTASSSGTVIATTGSHQQAFAASNDGFLVKFNTLGVRQWGTYFGGNIDDYGSSCSTDANGDVYVAGFSDSNTSTVIASPGCHQASSGGLVDAFLMKFNGSGVRQWGTYYGGTGYDWGISCTTNTTGNVYMAGYSDSGNGTTIATPGGHQTLNGGSYDAFLVEFSSSGLRQWGSYYGGIGVDYGFSCATYASGNFYLAGRTASGSGTVIATTGAHQSAFGGNDDAFLVNFSSCVSVSTTLLGQVNPLCYGGSNGSATVTALGGSNLTYTWLPGGGNSPSSGSLGVGIQSCVVTNSCGSMAMQTVNIVQPNAITITATASNSNLCIGNQATLSAQASGGTGTVMYGWASGPNTSQWSVSPVANTIYTVMATDANNCSQSQTVVVNTHSLPLISANGGSICLGNSFTISPSGANTYTFSSGAVVSPSASTVYSISGANIYGCVSNLALCHVTVVPLPIITVNSGTVCAGQAFSLMPTGAMSYTFLNGSFVIFPLSNTTYSVIGTGIAGCTNSLPATCEVTVYPLPIISVNNGAICSGQSFTIVAGGGVNYIYSTGNPVFSPSSSTSYSVTGTSSTGCVNSTASVGHVTVHPIPAILIQSSHALLCSGESVTLTATGASNYTWSNGPTTPIHISNPFSTSTFTVTGLDSNSCFGKSVYIQIVDECNGIIRRFSKENDITVSPNPGNGEYTILINSKDTYSTLEIYNMQGQLVASEQDVRSKSVISLRNQAQGAFYFIFRKNNHITVVRVVKL